MARIDLEADYSQDNYPETKYNRLKGKGTMEEPYRADAHPEYIEEMRKEAIENQTQVYWTFEETKMRFNPDGTLEDAIKALPIRPEVRELIEKVLSGESKE